MAFPGPATNAQHPTPGSLAIRGPAPQPQRTPEYRTSQQRLQDYPETWWNPDAKALHDSRLETEKLSRYSTMENMVLAGLKEVRAQAAEGRTVEETERVRGVQAELNRMNMQNPGSRDRVLALLAQLDPVAAAKLMAQDVKGQEPRIMQTSEGIFMVHPDTGQVETLHMNSKSPETSSDKWINILSPDGKTKKSIQESQFGPLAAQGWVKTGTGGLTDRVGDMERLMGQAGFGNSGGRKDTSKLEEKLDTALDRIERLQAERDSRRK